MNKTLLMLPVLALTACDRPTTSIELECNLAKDWQSPVSMLRTDKDFLGGDSVRVDVKTYHDHAVLVVNGKESNFYKSKEEKIAGEFGRAFVDYHGVFPDTNRLATFTLHGDIASKTILQFNLSFDGEYSIFFNVKRLGVSYQCRPTKKEYQGDSWDANAPWNHNYKMPNKIEKCINTIVDMVQCDNEECDRLNIYYDFGHYYLTAEEAMKISSNWDYSNMRHYMNDGRLDEHEMDACEVVDRLVKYIDEARLSDSRVIEDAMRECGEECDLVLTTGDHGDFLIRLPESEALLKIANKTKNRKFLSVFNPNSYAKSGYCLLNIIPYNTMEKLGWENKDCHYRLYCGAPEFMDYDQYYSVEVCD